MHEVVREGLRLPDSCRMNFKLVGFCFDPKLVEINYIPKRTREVLY